MKKLLSILIICYNAASAQIKVTPGGDLAIGQNYVSSGFKTEINGERKIALGINTRHNYDWGWAGISNSYQPHTKHWIVSQNGYGKHNFFVTTEGVAYAKLFWSLSDSSVKTNIKDVHNAGQLISQLKPKY
jgi:hypothetical protein